MNKRKLLITLLHLFLILILSNCSGGGLKGKYVNPDEEDFYLEFLTNEKVLYNANAAYEGTYMINGDRLIVSVRAFGTDWIVNFSISQDKKILSSDEQYGMDNLVKIE